MPLRRAAALVAALLCFTGGIALLRQAGLPERATYTGSLSAGDFTAPEIGATAPPLRAALLNGDEVDLASLRGTIIILNFWATWCQPCEIEMPILQGLQDRYLTTQLRVVAINTGEDRTTIEAWAARLQLSLPIVRDPDLKIASAYHVRGQPQTFVIDREGVIRAIFFGAADDSTLSATIEPLL
jgi:peroxiredoxin